MIDLYAGNKELFWFLCLVAPFAACLAYEVGWRRQHSHGAGAGTPYVTRFRWREMLMHWLCMLLGLVLIGTGVYQIMGSPGRGHIGTWHECMGYILAIVAIIMLTSWARDCRFRSYDFTWFKVMGGYLGSSSTLPPAGRFNAGQKLYFWLINALIMVLLISGIIMEQHPQGAAHRMGTVWSVHGLAGCMFMMAVIGHAYLSLFINPATARVLLDGRISRDYLRKHHSRMEP